MSRKGKWRLAVLDSLVPQTRGRQVKRWHRTLRAILRFLTSVKKRVNWISYLQKNVSFKQWLMLLGSSASLRYFFLSFFASGITEVGESFFVIHSSVKVEATDDDCNNRDHRVCGYEIITPNVPFTIDNNGSISITKALTNNQYDFDVIARDCYPSSDRSKQTSQPARVTFKIIPSCSPSLNGRKRLDHSGLHLTSMMWCRQGAEAVRCSIRPYSSVRHDRCQRMRRNMPSGRYRRNRDAGCSWIGQWLWSSTVLYVLSREEIGFQQMFSLL